MKTLMACLLVACVTAGARAQHSGLDLELHANENVSPSSLGLPLFPGARAFRSASSDSAIDMGFTFGSIHFRILASKYAVKASPDQVLDYYRKPLARYGEVLECEHGHQVGSVAETSGGLTCSNSHHHDSHTNLDVSDNHQLRSGTERKFRVVAIDTVAKGETRFSLVYLEVPKDSDKR